LKLPTASTQLLVVTTLATIAESCSRLAVT